MKAAVFYGARDFRVEDIPEPHISPTDVLVRVRACGICGSDLHTFRQGVFSRPGFVMGHEIAGDAVKVGSQVKGIKVGDRVIPMVTEHTREAEGCGECFWCTRGQPQWCPSVAHKPCGKCEPCNSGKFWLCEQLQRHLLIGYSRNGGYAEYVAVPDAVLNENVFKMPDSMSYEEAAFIEPLAGAYHWVSLGEPQKQETAVVTGLGTIGLLVMQLLKAQVAKVLAVEVSPKRLELAGKLGADAVINARQEDPVQKIIDITGSGRSFSGKGGACADLVMECSGAPAVLQQALDMTRAGGRIVLVGLFEEKATINVNAIIHKQLRLISSFNHLTQPMSHIIRESIRLVAEGKVNVKPLISHQIPLDDIMSAFEVQTRPGEAVKVLVKP